MDYCPQFSAWLLGFNNEKAIISRARCGQWDCPYCADKNREIWRARLLRAINVHGGNWWMWTFTAHERAESPKACLANLRRGWAQGYKGFVKHKHPDGSLSVQWVDRPGLKPYFQDQFGADNWLWVKIYEPHQSGRLHVHMLSNLSPIDQVKCEARGLKHGSRQFKDMCRLLGMGHQTDIQSLGNNPAIAASYVTKYMTKELAELPKYTRRIETSRNFLVADETPTSDLLWLRLDKITLADVEPFREQGIAPYDQQLHRIVTVHDFPYGLYAPIADDLVSLLTR